MLCYSGNVQILIIVSYKALIIKSCFYIDFKTKQNFDILVVCLCLLVCVCCIFQPASGCFMWCDHASPNIACWSHELFQSNLFGNRFDGTEGTAHNVIACTALNPHSTLLNIEPVPQVLKQVVNLSCLYMFSIKWSIG